MELMGFLLDEWENTMEGRDAFIKLMELEHHNKQRPKNKTSSTNCLQP